MERYILIICCFAIAISSFAKTEEVYAIDSAKIKVTYNRTMVLDTLYPNDKYKNDILTLIAGNKGSAFYSEENRKDSEMSMNTDYVLKVFQDQNLLKRVSRLENEKIFRDYKNNTTIVHQRYDMTNWELKEDIANPKWEVKDSIITILGYNCIMATSNFRGRKWVAFFSPEILVPEGPWKLIGLPGIILKAYDEKNHYCYEAIEINTKNPGMVEYFNYRDRVKIPNRIKGLIQRHKSQSQNIRNKIQAAYGISHKNIKTDTTNVKRYDFEETDYPHD